MNTVFPSQEADEDRPQCGYAIRRYRTELNLDDCECTEAGNNLREEDCGSLRNRKSDQLRDTAQERTGDLSYLYKHIDAIVSVSKGMIAHLGERGW